MFVDIIQNSAYVMESVYILSFFLAGSHVISSGLTCVSVIWSL